MNRHSRNDHMKSPLVTCCDSTLRSYNSQSLSSTHSDMQHNILYTHNIYYIYIQEAGAEHHFVTSSMVPVYIRIETKAIYTSISKANECFCRPAHVIQIIECNISQGWFRGQFWRSEARTWTAGKATGCVSARFQLTLLLQSSGNGVGVWYLRFPRWCSSDGQLRRLQHKPSITQRCI